MSVEKEKKEGSEKLFLSILMVFVGILFLSSISISQHAKNEPITITVQPSVLREGEPFIVKFNLNNPTQHEDLVDYKLHANSELLTEGSELLERTSARQFIYVYPESPKIGERITFSVKTKSDQGAFEKTLSIPAYPPQIWSSFVSFSSFSTSVLSSSKNPSLTSLAAYESKFVDGNRISLGLIFSLVLITLLIFLELTEPMGTRGFMIAGLRIRVGRLSAILFIVFVGMVLTKVVLVLG